MVTLGIETSCDETACALVQEARVLSNIVSSSVPLHERFGGVIPEIASRFHIEYINYVTRRALRKAGKTLRDLDLIAVTETPGLPGSLLTGISFAKALSYSTGAPLIGVNHLYAHIYANFLNNAAPVEFPFLGVVVSGGHTSIFISRSFKDFETVGKTKDDAIGEAFDKVAKILGIGYPGGPKVERYARRRGFLKGQPINFPRAYLDDGSLDFSLSGIKTAVLYYAKSRKINRKEISRISWSFQESVFSVLTEKITGASRKFGIKNVLLGGGVIANKSLRAKLKESARRFGYKIFYPKPALCVDNAAMVAGLGEAVHKEGEAK